MTTRDPIISRQMLSAATFRDSLKSFLNLSVDQLQELNSISDSPDGLLPPIQTMTFSERAKISPERAREVLRVAFIIYEKCRDNRISPDEGVAELVELSKLLDVPDTNQKQEILRLLLSTKEAFESGKRVEIAALEVGPHFEGVEGVWDIRPIFHRELEKTVAKVPILLMRVSWHDGTGETREAVFQLDEDGWQELKKKIDELERQREALRRHMQET